MRAATNKTERGFTLMELSLAMLIFLIGSLGLLQLLVAGTKMNQRSRDIVMTASLAQAKADELSYADFFSLELARGGSIPLTLSRSPLSNVNPAPVSGYCDFYDYNGNRIGVAAAPKGDPQPAPTDVYFVRQWQIRSCNCATSDPCDLGCTPVPANDYLKKITVTVTAVKPSILGSYPSTTVAVYKSRLN